MAPTGESDRQPDHPDGSFIYKMRAGNHWYFPVAPSHAARKKERRLFVAEVARYNNNVISFNDRLRSYMKTFYDSVIKQLVSGLDMDNIRGLLLEELRRPNPPQPQPTSASLSPSF